MKDVPIASSNYQEGRNRKTNVKGLVHNHRELTTSLASQHRYSCLRKKKKKRPGRTKASLGVSCSLSKLVKQAQDHFHEKNW